MQVLSFCENHTDVPAVAEYILTSGNAKPRRIDVCKACEEGIVQPLLALLAKGVVPGEVTLAATGKVACPLDCGVELADRQGLSRHLRTVHNKGIRELRSEGVAV